MNLLKEYEIWKQYESDTFPGYANVSSYALFSFDATWSLVLSCLDYTNISNCYYRQFLNSKKYYNIMKTIKFLGVSGR